LSDILSAFSLLQDKNIIHEGICPENIMFNDDYKVKLADLGLSRNENYYYQAVKKPFNTYSTLR
jgi:serine/threonine protein kinase